MNNDISYGINVNNSNNNNSSKVARWCLLTLNMCQGYTLLPRQPHLGWQVRAKIYYGIV